ncbi:MAG: hypothetical protein SF123_09375 [Chloroflexota bacterium]|nr:hypothetical protein [Chloroflexota bacterium]
MVVDDDFQSTLNPAWTTIEVGSSRVVRSDGELTLTNLPVTRGYTNAQMTDYNYRSFEFRWRPPLRMSVTARASMSGDKLCGTAGFGFWNHPFSPDVEHVHRRLRLPQAIWFFFGSPPSDMQLAHGVSGYGWKAAQIDAGRPSALLLAPFALPAVALMQLKPLYDMLYPPIQRGLAIAEHRLDDHLLAEKHTYTIDWRLDSATFCVDEQVVLQTAFAPRGACGFVAWIDNQYAIVTPRGKFGGGVVPLEHEQTLYLNHVSIESK